MIAQMQEHDEDGDSAAEGPLTGIPYTHEWIVADELEIGTASYQRPIDQRWVKKLADEFDPFLLDDLLVNRTRDGRLIVMDGQHRVLMVRSIGYGDQKVPCKVYDNLSEDMQAKRFNVQQAHKRLTAQDQFRGALWARDTDAIMVDAVVRKVGYRLNLDTGETDNGRIVCVGELLRLHRHARRDLLEDVLRIAAESFGLDEGPSRPILAGLGRFVARFRGTQGYQRQRVVDVLRQTTRAMLLAEGADAARVLGKPSADGVAYAIWKAYNARRLAGNRLPEFA